jgi:hypothetical protein
MVMNMNSAGNSTMCGARSTCDRPFWIMIPQLTPLTSPTPKKARAASTTISAARPMKAMETIAGRMLGSTSRTMILRLRVPSVRDASTKSRSAHTMVCALATRAMVGTARIESANVAHTV